MRSKQYIVLLLVCSGIVMSSCSGETRRNQLHLDDRTQVSYAEVRGEIDAGAETLQGDIRQRLDVLKVYIDDMMKKYRTAGEERKESLQPELEKLKTLIGEVEGTLKTFSPGEEKLSDEQQQQIIEKMQELRSTYHHLVTRLGITWH